jgi:hypothetical protein
MSKPRPESKLLNLPDDQQAQIVDWLLSGMPYYAVAAMILKEFEIRCSNSVLSRFYKIAVEPALLVRRRRAVETANAIGEEAAQHPGRMDQATVDALKQRAFELSINPQVNPKDVKAIFALVLKARDQELSEQQLALDRDRFQFDAAKACLKKLPELKAIASDTAMDEDAKLLAVREKLFGEIPE